MSFDIYNKKPKLIEPKLLKYYNKKIKNEEIKQNIISISLYKKIWENIWNYIKENYGFFLIITLIIILLYVRYIEVDKKKKKINNILTQINKENEIHQFIELQEINNKLSRYN
jgi:hypothetical protein